MILWLQILTQDGPIVTDVKWWQIVASFFFFPPSSLLESLVQQRKYNFIENMLCHSWHGYISYSHKTSFPPFPNVAYFELLLFFPHAFQACQI